MNKLPSARKILQALYYLQSNAPRDNNDRFNRVYLLKMLYFADRYHLRHFGNLASNDKYFAMALGPVASVAYNVLKKSSYNINSAETECLSDVKELSENDVEIEYQNDDELSKSFKNALDFTLKEFGYYGWKKQSDISHCYPEWKKHRSELTPANPRIPMELQDFFDDPDDDACFLEFGKNYDPFKEDKEFLALLRDDLNAIPA
jgi:uncharacterized phage-associated protein